MNYISRLVTLALLFSISLYGQGSCIAQPSNALTGVPVGFVMAFPGEEQALSPQKATWMICDGRSLVIRQYPSLFRCIGWTYGLGKDPQGRTTFNLPDYRGYFLRGASEDTDRDPDKNERKEHFTGQQVGNLVGSKQDDTLQSHKHDDKGHTHPTDATNARGEVQSDNSDERAAPPSPPQSIPQVGKADLTDPTDSGSGAGKPRHGKETRPKNIYVHWVIKVK